MIKTAQPELRKYRNFAILDKKTNSTITLASGEYFKINSKEFLVQKHHNASLFCNIAIKNRDLAAHYFKSTLKPKINKNRIIKFDEDELPLLFDYFEHLKISVIATYTAIESFSNHAIPDDFKYEKKKELLDKYTIEKSVELKEKISKVLPKILNCPSPTKMTIYDDFTKLIKIRHDITHPKTFTTNNGPSSEEIKPYFEENIFRYISSGLQLIKYFCEKDHSNQRFPYGFSEVTIKPIELDDFSKHFDIENTK